MPITAETTVTKTIETMEEYLAVLKERSASKHGCKRGDFLKITGDSNSNDFPIGAVVVALRDADSDSDVVAFGYRGRLGMDSAFVESDDYEVVTEAEALALPLPA